MTAAILPPSLTNAIAAAVARSGGDATDFADLCAVWRDVSIDTSRRAAAICGAVARARCRCADGGDPNGGRCARCYCLCLPREAQ